MLEERSCSEGSLVSFLTKVMCLFEYMFVLAEKES